LDSSFHYNKKIQDAIGFQFALQLDVLADKNKSSKNKDKTFLIEPMDRVVLKMLVSQTLFTVVRYD